MKPVNVEYGVPGNFKMLADNIVVENLVAYTLKYIQYYLMAVLIEIFPAAMYFQESPNIARRAELSQQNMTSFTWSLPTYQTQDVVSFV